MADIEIETGTPSTAFEGIAIAALAARDGAAGQATAAGTAAAQAQAQAAVAADHATSASLSASAAAAIERRASSYDDGAARYPGQDFSVLSGDGIAIYNSAIGDAPIATLPSYTELASDTGTQRVGNGRLPLDRALPQSASRFGVDPFTTNDQWQMIKAAIADAAEGGIKLQFHPDAQYRKDGPLIVSGQHLDGQGATFIGLSDGDQSLTLSGSGGSLKNVTTLLASTQRSEDTRKGAIVVRDATDWSLSRVRSSGVGQTLGTGSPVNAFYFDNAQDILTEHLVGEYSLADTYHHTNGTKRVRHKYPTSRFSGDDAFATVSYRSDHKMCEDILIEGAYAYKPAARSFAIVGGRNIRYKNCRGEESSAAGLYVLREGAYDTLGVDGWEFSGKLINCVTGINTNPGFLQPVIYIQGDTVGPDTLSDGSLGTLQVRGGRLDATIEGVGARANYALECNSPGVEGLIVDLVMRDLMGPNMNSDAFALIGGRDTRGIIRAYNASGSFVVGDALLGDCALDLFGGNIRNGGTLAPLHAGSINYASLRLGIGQFTDTTGSTQAISGSFDSRFTYDRLTRNSDTNFVFGNQDNRSWSPTNGASGFVGNSGWGLAAGSAIERANGIVTATIELTGGNGSSIGTLPAGYRPPIPVQAQIWSDATSAFVRAIIYPAGLIYAQADLGAGPLYLNAAFAGA